MLISGVCAGPRDGVVDRLPAEAARDRIAEEKLNGCAVCVELR